ncbi:MAG: hypothetical protein IPG51_13050 [Chloroflexi bacterium]|nr:hypothetical protein [Chloroflexota bacterium]
MSQLRQAAIPTTTDTQQFSSITWDEFVQLVIGLTILAYQQMRQNCPVRQDWKKTPLLTDWRMIICAPWPLTICRLCGGNTQQGAYTGYEEGQQAIIEAKKWIYPCMDFGSVIIGTNALCGKPSVSEAGSVTAV